jgi:hypothetical protein
VGFTVFASPDPLTTEPKDFGHEAYLALFRFASETPVIDALRAKLNFFWVT